jgi:hypothetical protein
MRIHNILLLLLIVAGCAGTPPAPETPAEVAKSGAEVTDPQKVDTDVIMAAQEGGQKLVNEDGQQMICRREKQTGSHLHQKTICMTREDWDKTAAASKQTMEDIARQRPPRQGT